VKTCIPTRLAALPFLALLAYLPTAQAATTDTGFQVTATVAATCSVSAGTLAFGSYVGDQLDAENTMTVTCTTGTTYDITLDNGLYLSGSQRRMKSAGTDYLNYDLYTTSGRTVLWQGATTVSDTGNAAPQSHPVYGRIPANQNPPATDYTDTISVTVTY
jgi:spore coat protein U-like protein